MVSIARATGMNPDTRQSALEFLAILIEHSPVMIRSLPPTILVIPLLHILFSMLTSIDDDPAWETSEEEPDESDLGPFTNALNVLGRVAEALRGRVFLPPLYALVDEYVQSENWRCRHAVMFALSEVADIVTDTQQRETICKYVIASFHDPHPRVRYASVRCLGQLATDFAPYLQKDLSVESLNAIFSLLDIAQPVRVRFITAAALSNFVDGSNPSLLEPVLSNMLNALVASLQSAPIIVQQQVGIRFRSHADHVRHRQHRRLRGRAPGALLRAHHADDQDALHPPAHLRHHAHRPRRPHRLPRQRARVHHVRGHRRGRRYLP